MAIRLKFVCEMCLLDDEEREVTGIPVLLRVDDSSAVVDLCREHRSVFVDPVIEMIRDHGRPEGSGGPELTTSRPAARSVVPPVTQAPADALRPVVRPAPQQTVKPKPKLKPKPKIAPSRAGGGATYPCPSCVNIRPYQTLPGLGYHLQREHKMTQGEYTALLSAGGRCRQCDAHHPTPQGMSAHVRSMHGLNNLSELTARLARTDPTKVADIIHELLRGQQQLRDRSVPPTTTTGGGQLQLDENDDDDTKPFEPEQPSIGERIQADMARTFDWENQHG